MADNLSPNNIRISPNVDNNFTWTGGVITAYEIKHRKKGETIWVTTNKVVSAIPSHSFITGTFAMDEQYEWKVRTWDATDIQSIWSVVATFTSYIAKIADIKPEGLRIVTLGDSLETSPLRIKVPSEIAEFDIVPTAHVSASKTRVNTPLGVKAIAIELPPHYGDYSDHGDVGYIAYNNHGNTGYSRYSNHSDSGYSAYSNHTESGYIKYCDHTDTGYTAYSNHTDYIDGGYDDYPAYVDHLNMGYNKYSDHSESGYTAYSNFSDSGYTKYSNFSDSGYSAYSNFTDGGYSKYSDHADS